MQLVDLQICEILQAKPPLTSSFTDMIKRTSTFVSAVGSTQLSNKANGLATMIMCSIIFLVVPIPHMNKSLQAFSKNK